VWWQGFSKRLSKWRNLQLLAWLGFKKRLFRKGNDLALKKEEHETLIKNFKLRLIFFMMTIKRTLLLKSNQTQVV
jgi:hypothetical protein